MLKYFLALAGLILMVMLIAKDLFASGPGAVISNNNQSPEFARTLNRNASTDIDAVFFNPAGTVKLEDGLHLGFSNQFIIKYNRVKDNTELLPKDEYTSSILSPIFPNLHVAYKKEKTAYMFGFDIMSGGGAGTFDEGLPLSDFLGIMYGAVMPAMAQGIPITSVSAESEYSGYFAGAGLTIGAAHALNDILSVSAGFRFVYGFGGTSAKVTPYLNGVKQPGAELEMTLSGNCYGVVLGANISPTQALNIGIRYSYYTKWELEQEIQDGKDLYGAFADADGEKTDNTIPQDIALGLSYHITRKLRVETSFAYYLNTATDWAEEKEKESGANIEDGWEAGAAIEYALLSNKLLASIGYHHSFKGLPDELQYDVSSKIDADSYGAGATYYITPTLDLTVGYIYSVDGCHEVVNTQSKIGSTQKFESVSQTLAVGFNIKF